MRHVALACIALSLGGCCWKMAVFAPETEPGKTLVEERAQLTARPTSAYVGECDSEQGHFVWVFQPASRGPGTEVAWAASSGELVYEYRSGTSIAPCFAPVRSYGRTPPCRPEKRVLAREWLGL